MRAEVKLKGVAEKTREAIEKFKQRSGEWVPATTWIDENIYDWSKVPQYGGIFDFTDSPLIKLLPYQRRILDHVLTPNEDGIFPYSQVIWSQPKKHGKTQIAAAVAAWWACMVESPNLVYTLASNQEQAAGLIFTSLKPSLFAVGGKVPNSTGSIPEIRIPNGTLVKAIPNNYAGQAGGNYGGTFWCLDDQTEVLTKDGWRTHETIKFDDHIATLNAEGHLEYQPMNGMFNERYAGPMHRMNHRRADFLVTPGHRVLGMFATNGRYWKREKEIGWRFETADKASTYRMGELRTLCGPADGVLHHTVEIGNLTFDADAFFEFIGYYIAEGHYGPNFIHIAQSKKVNGGTYDAIESCLLRLGVPINKVRATETGFYVRHRGLAEYCSMLGKSHDKHIPRNLLQAAKPQLELMFNAYIAGDGSWWPSKRYCQAKTVSTQLMNDLMELGMKVGYNPRMMQIIEGQNENQRPSYRLSFSKASVGFEKRNWSVEDYTGIVWCPSTDNGTAYIRRNGKCCWTGNSELWTYKTERDMRLWEEMPPVPTRKNSIRWVDTYAGFLDESELLYTQFGRIWGTGQGSNLRPDADERITQPGAVPVPGLEDIATSIGPGEPERPSCWHIPEERLFVFWDHEIRAPWITEEYMRQEKAGNRHSTYVRLWENRWQASTGTFLDPHMVDRAVTLDGELIGPMILAGDASQRNDHTALVGVQKYIANMFGVEQERYRVVRVRHWDPRASRVASELRRLGAKKHDIDLTKTIALEVKRAHDMGLMDGPFYYDPAQMHDVAMQLRNMGVPCVEFNQGKDRLDADTFLWTLFNEGRIDLFPGVLVDHVKNANAKEYENEQVRIIKGVASQINKVDAAVALSMAVWKASKRVSSQPGKHKTSSTGMFG